MYFCDFGIVLNSRPLRENDRIVTIFTKNNGKFEVNFKSVCLAKAKLRAIALPMSHGDYRFYLKKGSNFPICTGGNTLNVFANTRFNLKQMQLALYYCELVNKITPAWQPAEEKYNILVNAFEDLNNNGLAFWLSKSFTLRILESAGFGFRDTATGLDCFLWDTLNEGSWADVRKLPQDMYAAEYTDKLIARFFSSMNLELNTLQFVN